MPEDFNKNRLFDNISYLIKKNDLKIGEIENGAGVSAGYIARASKDEKSKPGIEFVMKVAELLLLMRIFLLRQESILLRHRLRLPIHTSEKFFLRRIFYANLKKNWKLMM